jgi:c-di-GMP-binding flagellar brake protein YcgR
MVGAASWLVTQDDRYDAECVDVSMGGAAVRTQARLATGSAVRFELSRGWDHRAITITCEVVRSSEGELGLRFLALTRASLEALAALL